MSEESIDHGMFTEAKSMRKRAEEDAKLLSNRIALLKQEEAKAIKKIEDTRKKAQEIIESRTKNMEAQRKREELRQAKELEESIKFQELKNQKELNKQIKDEKKQSLKSKVCSEARSIKQLQLENLEIIEQKKLENIQAKIAAKQEIQRQKSLAEERRRRLEMERRAFMRMELERKIEEENRVRREKEDFVARMEQEELELIQRLQNTQLLQKNAFEDLQAAMNGDVTMDSYAY